MQNLRNTVFAIFALVLSAITPAHAQWEQTNTPTGTVIRAFASIGSNVFAGGYQYVNYSSNSCVLLSMDGGNTWINTNIPTHNDVWSLFSGDSNIFAGTDNGGVFLSTNNGTTWSQLGQLPTVSVRSIGKIGTILFAGTYGRGVFRSTDNGTTWIEVNNGITHITINNTDTIVVNAFATIGNTIFAGTYGGVFRSTDSGASWTGANSGLETVNGGGNFIPEVYALRLIGTTTFAGTEPNYIYLSTDSGTSWVSANGGLNSVTDQTCTAFAVSCANLFAGVFEGGVFRSGSNYTSWAPINNGLGDDIIFSSLALWVSGGYLFLSPWGGDTGGVWRLPLDEIMILEQLPISSSGDTVQASFCSPSNFSFTLQTIGGCTNPTLDRVSIMGLDSDEYELSRTYHPDGPDTCWVTVSPSKPGLWPVNVAAQYTHDSDVVSDTSFTLTLNVSPAQSLSINLPPGQLSDTNQGTISIPIYASSVTAVNGGTVTFRLNMRTDLLTPESISTTIPGAGTAPLQVDDSGVWITLTLPSSFSILTDTLIATLVCRAYVTDTNETAISVASSSGTSNCLSILGSGGETFTLIPQCGDATLTQFLLTGSPVTITGIVPNPAQTSIEVQLSPSSPTPISFTLSDPLGRSYAVKQTGNTLDISSLPSGVYFISDGVSRAKFVKE